MSGNLPRTPESEIDPITNSYSRRRTSVSKKYLPNFTGEQHALPSIDKFKLDYILSNELKAESQELANSMIQVSKNYQQDLRKEIRHKLTLEQKIQYKNINVAKLSHTLNKRIASRNKKLSKVSSKLDSTGGNQDLYKNNLTHSKDINHFGKYKEGGIGGDASQLLDLSIETSDLLNSLSLKLSKIDLLVNADSKQEILGSTSSEKNKEFPHLAKLLQKNVFSKSSKTGSSKESQGPTKVDSCHVFQDQVVSNDEHISASSSLSVVSSNGDGHVRLLQPSQDGPISSIESNDTGHDIGAPTNKDSAIKDLDLDNPETFESFMADTITKFRAHQEARPRDHDDDWVFQVTNQDTNGPLGHLQDTGSTESESNSITHPNQSTANPLNLLYSSVTKSKSNEPRSLILTPVSVSTVKSVPTVESTPQVSHFKKLRINGSPITSAKFANGSSFSRPIYSPFQDGGTIVIDGVRSSYSTKEKLKKRISGQEKMPDKCPKVSPAKKALENSLALNSLRISSESEDNWDSSALNTDTDDEDINTDHDFADDASDEPLNSTESSDYDSSSSEDLQDEDHQTVADDTNQYYSMLRDNLKLRKKKKKQSKASQYKRSKSSSPTPKFKPSHHTLKPKKSILKLPRTVPSLAKVHSSHAQVKVSTSMDPDTIVDLPEEKPNGSPEASSGDHALDVIGSEGTTNVGTYRSDNNIESSIVGSSIISDNVAIGTILKSSPDNSSIPINEMQPDQDLNHDPGPKKHVKELKSISSLKNFLG